MEQETVFIRNQGGVTVLSDLLQSLDQCEGFCFTVAFMTFGGVQLLVQKLSELEQRGIYGRVLTSTYQQFSEPKAIEKLQSFKNIEVRLYDQVIEGGLHAKGYLFMKGELVEVYIGSSNLTTSALKENIEWNVKLTKSKSDVMVEDVLSDYELLWEAAGSLTKEKLEKYKASYQRFKAFERESLLEVEDALLLPSEVRPNLMQQAAMKRLNSLRQRGEKKALVIAATVA